jgi:hypothetical protein
MTKCCCCCCFCQCRPLDHHCRLCGFHPILRPVGPLPHQPAPARRLQPEHATQRTFLKHRGKKTRIVLTSAIDRANLPYRLPHFLDHSFRNRTRSSTQSIVACMRHLLSCLTCCSGVKSRVAKQRQLVFCKVTSQSSPASLGHECAAALRPQTIPYVPRKPTVFHLNQALAGDEKPAFVVHVAA